MEYQDKVLDHEYDGIQELDNNLPRWWLGLFYFTIAWAFVYMIFYHVLDIGYLQEEEYLKEVDPNYVRADAAEARFLGFFPEYHSPYHSFGGDLTPRQKAMMSGDLGPVMLTSETDTNTYVALIDDGDLSAGKKTFTIQCSQCHGQFGQGGIGPNLTDDYWLHPTGMNGVVRSVKYGYPAKGMISWRGMLKEEQILQVASYVLTLRGTNPPNPKAPQGELITE